MTSWHLLYCKRGQVLRAQAHLEQQGVTCFFPQYNVERINRGKRIVKTEPLFPGYLFIEFDPEKIHTTAIASTRGVSHFIRFGTTPAKIPASVVKALMMQPMMTSLQSDLPQKGDSVEITEGIFAGLQAIYSEPEGETRSILLLNLLNRQVPHTIENQNFKKIE